MKGDWINLHDTSLSGTQYCLISTPYLTELSAFWWLHQWGHFVIIIIKNLNLISDQSWTNLPKILSFSALGKITPKIIRLFQMWPKESFHLQNMIRSPSKIAKCISKTLPGNLQRYRKDMQTKKTPNIWTWMRNISVLVLHFLAFFRFFKIVLFHTGSDYS